MQTKLSRICDAIIEAGWLAVLVVAPLFFNTYSSRVFEPDKIHLVRSIAVIMAVAWIVQLLDGGLRRRNDARVGAGLRNTPLALPALLLVASYLLSTALSVVPRVSLLGSYVRGQGAFSFLSYVAIGAMVLTHLRRRSQVNRLVLTIILTSLPIAIYGVIQQAGLDPLPWGGDVRERVAANMGNSIFVAAYLIMTMFLTLERLLTSFSRLVRTAGTSIGEVLRPAVYLFIFAVQLLTLVFTQSRGPQFAFLAGLYVFLMLGVLLVARWAIGRGNASGVTGFLVRRLRVVWVGLIGLAVGLSVLVLVMNAPSGPLRGLCEVRYISRICTVANVSEGTNAVRALIWEGVIDLVFKPHAPLQWPDGRIDVLNPIRSLIGYGPESMWVAYNRYYPAALANIESRNASPDRSHNETFDALVRGGLIQFAAQIWLFTGLFFYGLRWLGLLQGRGRRNLFISFLTAGGLLGVLVPVIVERSLRLAGIGLPLGLVAAMMAYVTYDLLSTGDPLRDAAGQGNQPHAAASERWRQALVLAFLAAIVAHFVEVHLGIAIVSTQTHFWVLAAAMVAIGMNWVVDDADAAPAVDPVSPPQPVATGAARKAKKAARGPNPSAVGGAVRMAQGSAPVKSRPAVLWLLPYAAVGILITMVLVWNYTINQGAARGAWAVLWNAFTTRSDGFGVVASPMLLVMVLLTWVSGAILSVAAAREDAGRSRLSWGKGLLVYLAIVGGAFLIFGLVQAGRQNFGTLSGLDIFHRRAAHIVVFDVLLLVTVLGTAIVIAFTRPMPTRGTNYGVALAAPVALGLSIFAVVLIVVTNIRPVQADTYYKSGLSYESAYDWQSSVILYREAARRQPNEDYFYLFLGRGLLQLSDMVAQGTATLPQNLDNVATSDLLNVVDRGVRAGTREDILRAAYAALTAAQRLNPLNTDHSANLARLTRAWAFSGAVAPEDASDPNRLRAALADNPAAVNQARLNEALDHYRAAVALSPQNAGLWNELASTQYIVDDLRGAEASLNKSLALDRTYYPTQLILGDVLTALGDTAGGLAAYRQAAQRGANDLSVLSALGVAAADAGEVADAVAAFERIVVLQTQALGAAEGQLAELDAQATAAGGYDRLPGDATSRRQGLEATIASRRSQIYLAQRNVVLVYRAAGRTAEALAAAEQALQVATEAQRAEIEQLIAELRG